MYISSLKKHILVYTFIFMCASIFCFVFIHLVGRLIIKFSFSFIKLAWNWGIVFIHIVGKFISKESSLFMKFAKLKWDSCSCCHLVNWSHCSSEITNILTCRIDILQYSCIWTFIRETWHDMIAAWILTRTDYVSGNVCLFKSYLSLQTKKTTH